MQRIGFVGLGTMGRPMVRRLLDAGHEVTVWNRSAGPAEELAGHGAHVAGDLQEAFDQPIVLSILADDRAVRERVLDSGVLEEVRARVHVNLATVSPELAAEAAARHEERGVGYLAAPVLGRADVALAGKLNVLLAGPPDARELVTPVLEAVAARVWDLGAVAATANVVKIAVNAMLGAAVEMTGEAVAMVESYGVDAGQFVELVSGTLFPGPVYGTYGALMAQRDYLPAGFTAQLGLKDIRLALAAAERHDVQLPTSALVETRLTQAIDAGWADRDWAALVEVARRTAPGELPD